MIFLKKHLDPGTSTALNGTAERGIDEESVEMVCNFKKKFNLKHFLRF